MSDRRRLAALLGYDGPQRQDVQALADYLEGLEPETPDERAERALGVERGRFERRPSILPLARNRDTGGVEPAWPEAAIAAMAGVMTPRAAMEGAPYTAENAVDAAGTAVTGTLGASVARGVRPSAGTLSEGGAGEPRARRPRLPIPRRQMTVNDPQRAAFPGIYKPSKEIAEEVVGRASQAPENPLMRQLFGVSRGDLGAMADEYGPGVESIIKTAQRPRGSEPARNVMTNRNAARIVGAIEAARDHPRGEPFYQGMKGWYVMDPAYQRLVELYGKEEGGRRFDRLNTLLGMASPGSEVLTEINRGSAANYYAQRGAFDTFERYGGLPEGHPDRARVDPEMARVMGHPYHRTAQAIPMRNYLERGEVDMGTPKVPAYLQASRERGRHSWRKPVGDAHFVRGIGLADTRGPSQNPGRSITTAELETLAPWWEERVARQLGVEPVPAQALGWGIFSPYTGVDTPAGKPKLELLTDRIERRSRQTGRQPEQVRDEVLSGDDFSMLSPAMRRALAQQLMMTG